MSERITRSRMMKRATPDGVDISTPKRAKSSQTTILENQTTQSPAVDGLSTVNGMKTALLESHANKLNLHGTKYEHSRTELSTHISKPSLISASTTEKNNWEGFCEIESDPAYFNVMLEEFGIEGIRVQEVFSLDSEFMVDFPETYGLVFLSRYREPDDNILDSPCPEHVWFANQTAENACCTIALLNIVNNVPEIELGDHLRSFRRFTQAFTPPIRGSTISSWRLLKAIHNSFARKMDMLKLDMITKGEAEKWKKKKNRQAKSSAKHGNKAKHDNVGSIDDDDFPPVYHYVSFVPIKGELWRLDGMDPNPVNLGPITGKNWLDTATPLLRARMTLFEGIENEFSLLALVKDPLAAKRDALVSNVRMLQLLEQRLDDISPSWRDIFGISSRTSEESGRETTLTQGSKEFGITSDMVRRASVPEHRIKAISEDSDPNTLIDLWDRLQDKQVSLRESMRDQQKVSTLEHAADREKAEERRHEYSGYIYDHLKKLAENGVLEEIVKDVQQGKHSER